MFDGIVKHLENTSEIKLGCSSKIVIDCRVIQGL